MRKNKKAIGGAVAGVAAAAICGLFALNAAYVPGGSSALNASEGLVTETKALSNASSKYEQESADKFAEILNIQRSDGEMLALSDVPEADYSGFLFEPADAASGAGDAKAKLASAANQGLVREVAGGIYAVDSLDTLAGLFDANELAYIEPNYTLHLLDDSPSYLSAQQATKGSAFDVNGGTTANPAPDWPPTDQRYAAGQLWNLDMLKIQGAWEAGLDGDVYVYNGKPVRTLDDGVTADPVKVAIIDTGLFGTGKSDTVQHEDLNYDLITPGYNFIDSIEGEAPDAHGHGTFVAGLIAGQVNNSKGVAGAMPNVTLVPEKVFDTGSASTEDVISAIYHATDSMNVDVINMSLGGEYNENTLEVACKHAVDEGVLVVASAGNDGNTTANYPAAYDCVVGVASVNSAKTRSSFSQIGKSVYVTAPGESVTSTYKDGADSYYTASGTSFSGPEVAALAAMVKSVYPDIDQATFMQFLIDTSEDLGAKGYDDYYGYGLVNFTDMAEAVLASQVMPWYQITPSVTDEDGNVIADATIELSAAEDIAWEADAEAEPPFDAGSLNTGDVVEPDACGTYHIHRGTYAYKVVADGYYTAAGTFKTYTLNQTLNVEMLDAYETSVRVVDSDGSAVSGALLSVVSDRAETPKSSDAATATSVFDLASKTYSYTASADGYEDASGSFTVQRSARTIDAVLYKAEELRNVSFEAVDADDNRVLSKGVSYAVYDASGVVIASAEDGSYRLASGKQYTVRVSKVGYESAELTFTVGDSATQHQTVELTAAQNTYTFNVIDESGKAISTATAKVANADGEPVEPRADNALRFNLTAGSYTYEVSAAGYESVTGSFEVATESHTLTITLKAVAHDVSFVVSDGESKAVIDDAAIKVSTAQALRSLPCKSEGVWSLTPGSYRYTVYKEGYTIAQGEFEMAGEDLEIAVNLQPKIGEEVAYAGGSGTEENPYLIATEEQLRYLASKTEIVRLTNSTAPTNKKDAITDSFKLVDDIELTQGEWLPIGNCESSSNYVSFSGTFDGNGHTVSGVSINQTSCDYQGFFGYAVGATIKNLTVSGSVAGRSYVGGIVGGVSYRYSSQYPSGNTEPTLIEQCGANVAVAGKYATGGIVGSAQASNSDIDGTFYDPGTAEGISISRCYSSGHITSVVNGAFTQNSSAAGGIVGSGREVVITSCYNTGDVEAGYNAGGLVGNSQINNVSSSYSTGMVAQYVNGTGYGGTAGGLAGSSYYNVYADCAYQPKDGGTAKSYYGSTDSASVFKNCKICEHAEMYRNEEFVSALNTSSVTGEVSDAFVMGRDYPLLSWQVAAGQLLAPAPHVIVQPESVPVSSAYRVGDEAEELVAEIDPVDEGTVTWVWYVSSQANGADAQLVAGATGTGTKARLVPSTQQRGVFYYHCVFTNTVSTETANDAASTSTNNAVVYVRSVTDAEIPQIVKLNPSKTHDINTGLAVKAGTDLQLSVEASVNDGGELTYQWYRAATLGGTVKAVSGATSAALDVDTSSVTTVYYYVEITNTTEPGNASTVKSDWITVQIKEYTIDDYEDLQAFRAAVNNGSTFAGQVVTLTTDIEIPEGTDWTPIGTMNNPFCGVFMGGTGYANSNNSTIKTHTISGLSIDGDAHGNQYLGLFGCTSNATICDLQVSGTITGAANTYAGLLVGYGYSSSASGEVTIENCSTLPGSSVEGKYAIGGLVGVTGAQMQCVANHADVHAYAYTATSADKAMTTRGAKAVGGVVGFDNYGIVADAYNTGNVTVDARGDGDGTVVAQYAGGVAGFLAYYSGVASAYNAGALTVGSLSDSPLTDSSNTLYAGSVAGYVASGMVNLHYLEGTFENGTNNSTSYDYADYHSKAFMKTAYFVKMMNTGSTSYTTSQFTLSTNGMPHLVWEDDVDDGDTSIVSAEPWITDVRSEDLPNITSTWKGTYYQNGVSRPIYVLADSPDGGTMTYVWQRRAADSESEDDWEDIAGSEGTIASEGDSAGVASYTIPVGEPYTAQFRVLITNAREGATDPEPMQATIPAISIEVKDESEGIYLNDMSAENSKDNPWVIDSAKRLKTFAALVSAQQTMPGLDDNCFTGQYVVLDADIDLNDEEFTPIGSYNSSEHASEFKGIFDGRNHTIGGLKIDRADSAVAQGLFASVYGATICNLEVAGDVSVEGSAWMTAGVCGYAYGSYFYNITNRVNVSGYERTGGIVANAGACKIVDCENLGAVTVNTAARESTYGATMTGGIVGYAWAGAAADSGAGIINCFNAGQVTGRVTDGEYRFGAIAGELGSDFASDAIAANYYLAGSVSSVNEGEADPTGIGAKSYVPQEDEEGICEAIESANSDATAWKLASCNGAAVNSGRWGNFARADLEETEASVHLVHSNNNQALYRVNTASNAALITARPEYAVAGANVSVGWENKVGFDVHDVSWKDTESQAVTQLGEGNFGNGTITMPAADVEFVVNYEHDATYRYALNGEIIYKGAAAPSDAGSVELKASSNGDGAPEGDTVTAAVAVGEGYQLKRVSAEGVFGTKITLTTVDALHYTFTMPSENVTFTVTLEDEGTEAAKRAKSLDVTRTATHRYSSDATYRTADLLYNTIALSGDGFGPHDPLMTYEFEGLSNPSLYEQTYSIAGDGIHTFTGTDLAKFIRQFAGEPPADTPVRIEAADGNYIECTYGDLTALVYNCYDETRQPLVHGLPVLLAYGSDGVPNTDGAVWLVFGQKSADDDNATKLLKGVTRICVGDDVNYSQHVWGVYTDMDAICGGTANDQQGQSDLHIRVYKGEELAGETVVSLTKIEQMANRDRGGIQHGYYSTAIYEDDDKSYSGPYTDFYEGYDLYKIFKRAGIPYEKDASVQFYQSGMNGLENSWKTVNVSLGYLAGNGEAGEGDYSNNYMKYAGDGYVSSGTLTGLRPIIAYGKNSYPLVWSSGTSGVNVYAYNYRGPLVAILPQNDVEGGDYVGANTVASCFLGLIEVHLSEDADYTPVDTLVDEDDQAAADDVLALIGALPAKVESDADAVAVDAAQAAYDALSLEARRLVDAREGSIEKLGAAVAAAAQYRAAQKEAGQDNPADGGDSAAASSDVPGIGQSVRLGSGANAAIYQVSKLASGAVAGEVLYKKSNAPKKAKSITVPATVKIGGGTYKVVGIGAKAFAKCKKLTKVTVGKNVRGFKPGAFKGAKKLKTLVVKTKLLTKKSVKGCLKGSKVKTVRVKVGSKKLNKKFVKKYRKLFVKKVAGKKARVR